MSDTTQDCTYTAMFKPAVAGIRGTSLTVSTANGNPGTFALGGSGVGAGATLDLAAQIAFGQNLAPSSIALDPSGNVLVVDAASKDVLRFAQGASGVGGGAGAAGTTLGSFTSPTAVAADTLGDVYVADAATGLV